MPNLNELSNPKLFSEFQKFRKLVGECSSTDDASINSIINDIDSVITKGYANSEIAKNPQRIACFVEAVASLSTLMYKEISVLYKKIDTYSGGLTTKLDDVLNLINFEFNPKFELSQITNPLLEIGSNLLTNYASNLTSTAENWAQKKANDGLRKIYSYISLLFTLSSEFKWAMYLIFIENVKASIIKRIDMLFKLKAAFKQLILDIDNTNASISSDDFQISLDNYIESLRLIEDTLLYTGVQKDAINNNELFDIALNDSILNNFETAKKLLIGQRNDLLEEILPEEESNKLLIKLSDKLLIPKSIDYTGEFSLIKTTSTDIEFNTSDILTYLEDIPNICVSTQKAINFYELEPAFSSLVRNSYWFEVKFEPTHDIIKIDENFFRIIKKETKNIADLKLVSKFGYSDQAFYIQVEKLNSLYHTVTPSRGAFSEYIEFKKDIDYSIEKTTQDFKYINGVYEITEVETKTLNSIVFSKAGLDKIITEWGQDIGWSFMLFFKYLVEDTRTVSQIFGTIFEVSHNFPLFDTQKVENPIVDSKSLFGDLPNPIQDLFTKFKSFNLKDLKSTLTNTSEISNFLNGTNLLEDQKNKLNAYMLYITTANNVLESFCPLKNTVSSFYMLLDNLQQLPATDDVLSAQVSKKWLLQINASIEAMMRKMTSRNSLSSDFTTITNIQNSNFYDGLLPNLLLDYNNLANIEVLTKFLGDLGLTYNRNTELDKKFNQYRTLITDLVETGYFQKLKDTENKMWLILASSFTSSLNLLINGERLEQLNDIFDAMEFEVDNLAISLGDLNEKLADLNSEEYKSQIKLIELFDGVGLNFISDFIKTGKFDEFLLENSNRWLGEHGKTVECINKLASRFFKGPEKNFLLSVSAYIKNLDISKILTVLDVENINLNISINLNFFNNLASETITDLKTSAKKISHLKNSIDLLDKKEKEITT